MPIDSVPPLAALGDPARWRIVELLATGPRSVGVIAQLCGLRQPQTTKHLQTLERAGLVTARRSAQRRYYVLDAESLRELVGALSGLADTVDSHRAEFDALAEYVAGVDEQRRAADRPRWADGQVFAFDRRVSAAPDTVWRYLTEPALLATWWTPRSLRISRLEFDARSGGRIVQEYVDAEDADGSAGVVGRATGSVITAESPTRLVFDLSPLLPDGTVAFTGRYDLQLRDDGDATALTVGLHITDSTIESADVVAGIRLGWNESLDGLVTTVATSDHDAQEQT